MTRVGLWLKLARLMAKLREPLRPGACLVGALGLLAATPTPVPVSAPAHARSPVPVAAPVSGQLSGAPADEAPEVLSRVDLAAASWTRNSEPGEAPARSDGDPALVHLSYDEQGMRWSAPFDTEEAGTFRLLLDWSPADDGLLIEIMIDGERLSPARDGWRPSATRLRSDLGPRWLGAGGHLLEFIAREQPPESGAQLHLTALELRAP